MATGSGSSRDEGKRGKVRRMLRAKKWQSASDREVAREAAVGRYLVRSVRGEMIAAGVIPPPEPGPFIGEVLAAKLFRPGTVARGGYVFGFDGSIVRIDVWQKLLRKKAAASKRTPTEPPPTKGQAMTPRAKKGREGTQ